MAVMTGLDGKSDHLGVAQVAVAASAWGTWALFLREAAVSPWVSAPYVFLLMGVFSLPLTWRGRRRATWSTGTWSLLVLHSALAAGNIATYFAAISRTTLAVAVLTHYLAPVIVAVAAPAIERMHVPGSRLASVVALLGLLLILEPWAGGTGRGDVVGGAVLGTASALCYAGNVFLARQLEPRIGAQRIIAYHGLLAGLMLLPGALMVGATVEPVSLAWLGAGALIPGALAGVVFIAGLARVGSARAAIFTYLEPVVAVALGWALWGEALGPPTVIGMLLIVGAGVAVSRAKPAPVAAAAG